MGHKNTNPVSYYLKYVNYEEVGEQSKNSFFSNLKFAENELLLNQFIGKKIILKFTNEIRCIECGRQTPKSYNQGNCYLCFMRLAKNDLCIVKPETCHFHLGTCREPEWGKINCFKKHKVYLANTSGLKVGITKEEPITNRWIDQGAMFGIEFLEVASRMDAGIIEKEISKFISDKTSWQKMISTNSENLDLSENKQKIYSTINKFLKNIEHRILNTPEIIINYPILKYPTKKISWKPQKLKPIEDTLVGIKGQYLLFENGVFNIRSNSGNQFYLES
ncbi:MAG: DUF2797 domain-containing protein [Leptospiraceae bacterium]|nr:DUF2797 domain-containing protein [Leptospiraceae bacterium]